MTDGAMPNPPLDFVRLYGSEIVKFPVHGAPMLLNTIDGIPVTMFCSQQQKDDLVKNFVHRQGDVFIVTALKSGTTWMQEICKHFIGKGSDNPLAAVPWLEIDKRAPLIGVPVEVANTIPSSKEGLRFFKSHWVRPSDHMTPNGRSKYIYVMRNGLDVCVSLYHHIRGFEAYGYTGDLNDFFEKFMAGEVDFGSWFAHVKAWWPRRKDADVLFINYETLLQDTKGTVKSIAEFVGAKLDDAAVDAIVTDSSFSEMKKRPMFYDMIRKPDASKWLRSGKAGDGKQSLTAEQVKRFEDRCKLEFVGEYAEIPWQHDHHHAHHHHHNTK